MAEIVSDKLQDGREPIPPNIPPREPKRRRRGVAIYVRSATKGRPDSIERQSQMCVRYANERFPGLEQSIFCDHGHSGLTHDRPALGEFLGRTGEFAVLVVEDQDRLARSFSLLATLLRTLRASRTSLHIACTGTQVDPGKIPIFAGPRTGRRRRVAAATVAAETAMRAERPGSDA